MFLHKDINPILKIYYISPMKNIPLLLMLACLTILGCNQIPGGNPSPNNGNDYYMFSITIDGVTHKVEGTYGNSYQWGLDTENRCYSLTEGTGAPGSIETNIVASLADKGAASYIAGDKFSLLLTFSNSNLSLGVNNSRLEDYNGFLYTNDLNWPASFCTDGQPNVFITNNAEFFTVPIDNFIITDLGSAGTMVPFTYGDPVIGSFSGTIYGCSNYSTSQVLDIPIQLEIEFVAPRIDY